MSPPRSRRRPVRETAPRYEVEPAQRLLLDTHTWIWWSTGSRQLGPLARQSIKSAAEVMFSAASAWEISIKIARRRLEVDRGVRIREHVLADRFRVLDITLEHATGTRSLPLVHGDPFDRLLISQAIAEGLTIVTADAVFARYPVPVLSAAR